MVYRVYVEKKEALANEARALLEDLRAFLGIQSLTGLRLFNRYDLEGISRELFDYAVQTVLSEPQLDTVTSEVPQGDTVFAVEYLPGQYVQRADSAAQCLQLLSPEQAKPKVACAKVYAIEGNGVTGEMMEAVAHHVINPVEARRASMEKPETLEMQADVPADVAVNMMSHGSSLPSTFAVTTMEQALISSEASRSSSLPILRSAFAPSVAISISEISFLRAP